METSPSEIDRRKVILESYYPMYIETRNRIERAQQLQDKAKALASSQRGKKCPYLVEIAIEESQRYMESIAPTIQANAAAMKKIREAVAAIPSPRARELLEARYLGPGIDPESGAQSARPTGWTLIYKQLFEKPGSTNRLWYWIRRGMSEINL